MFECSKPAQASHQIPTQFDAIPRQIRIYCLWQQELDRSNITCKMQLHNTYGYTSSSIRSISLGNASSSSSSSSNASSRNRRNQNRLMTILAIQALVAASYFLLSPSSLADDIVAADQHRSLAELAADAKLGSESSRSDKSYVPSFFSNWGEWPTWTPVQTTFRRLCTVDDRTSSYRRSLSLATVDRLIPNFVTQYWNNGSNKDNRFSRFLACNVGFNCTYDAITGYEECYDGTTIIDPYVTYKKDLISIPEGGNKNIGYVMTISTCPANVDAAGNPLIDAQSYYDAYAVLRHCLCAITTQSEELINGLPPNTKYDYTIYAVLHPDAVVCTSTTGAQIDMVAVLKDLGYNVKIYDEAVKEVEMTGDPYVKNNIVNDVGFEDLVRLHSYRLTAHPLVMMVEPSTMFLEPIDEVFDSMIADDSIEASYVKSSDGLIDMGSMIIRPSETTFDSVKQTLIDTPYTAANGWGGSGIGAGGPGSGGLGSKGLLTYYYEGSPAPVPSTELDKCTYSNDMSAACRTKNINEVKVAKIGTEDCPPAWKCDDTGEEFQLCKDFHSKWSKKRKDFESKHWKMTPFASRKGLFDTDSFKGYCDAKGKESYHNMLEWSGEPKTNFDGVPYIPQEIYQDETLIGCGTMNCGTDFVSADCTCVSDPCDACPEGTRCQNDGINPPMCIDCTCGFCDYDERPCCDFNGVNNCKAASSRKECKMQFDFFANYPGNGNVCGGVEITHTAVPNGCGCKPNAITVCAYDPNERTKADACNICTAMDLSPADPLSPSVASVKDSGCGSCKSCLEACPVKSGVKKPTADCFAVAADVHDLESCLAQTDEACRAGCTQCTK